MTTLTFIIPVRHQDNARDWSRLKANLAQTVASISNQADGDWNGVIVANEGADLPDLPDRFRVEWVQFGPNLMHEKGGGSTEDFLDAFRIDKGRRVLKGMLSSRDSRFFMIVDDDDFVSSRLAGFVAQHTEAPGWTVNLGYIWDDGGNLLLQHDKLNHVCGTTLIVRSDLYGLPQRFEDASQDYIKTMLGSHRRIDDILTARATPLRQLPFRGAIYRVGHAGSHSQAPKILRKYVWNWGALRRPQQLLNLLRLRPVDTAVRKEFFGSR
ncbi:galactosyl transferase [uncultured Ramlibacter sp.]|uniref:galactosyl transferase n=1 Tax=uncultured Ramlibacter sp. TaxID=260755 RepID=UPI002614D77E|nr:galactosyl transferase [uncultured Ramlibacter sp.]